MENRINGDNKQQHNRNTLEELPSKKLNKKVEPWNNNDEEKLLAGFNKIKSFSGGI